MLHYDENIGIHVKHFLRFFGSLGIRKNFDHFSLKVGIELVGNRALFSF